MTILFLAIDVALFFNNYVNPIGLDHIHWKYYIVYDCWLAVELAVIYFFWVETRNTPLEEIAKYFDGDNAIIGGDMANEKSRQLEAHLDMQDAPTVYGEGEKNTGTTTTAEVAEGNV